VALPPAAVTRELQGLALRHSLWLALWNAQQLGFEDIERQVMLLLSEVELRREDAAA